MSYVRILHGVLYCVTLGSPSFNEGEEEEESRSNGAQNVQSHSNLSGRDVVARFHVGTRVIRGPDWKWGDQVSIFKSYLQLFLIWLVLK